MSVLRNIASGLRSLFQKEQVSQELDEELGGFLEMAAEEKMEQGMSRKDAFRAVRLERGSVEVTREVVRSAGWESLVETCWQDLRFAARMLHKNPAFTAVAVLMLALGIGANTAMFSVVNGVLLNPLPYPNPDRLVTLAEKLPQFAEFPISYPDFLDWAGMNHTFQALAAYRRSDFNLTGSGEAKRVKAMQVSASFFPLLGAKPVIGRDFSPDEDKRGAAPVVMLSAGLWRSQFGGSHEILGKTLALDGTAYTVIGVVPADFYFCCESTGSQLVYGVLARLVAQRTHEIGIRVALGASCHEVLRLVAVPALRMTVAGLGIGLVVAIGLTRLLGGLLFGVRPTDPFTFVAVATLFCAVALFACYVPARRAIGMDPMVALRYE